MATGEILVINPNSNPEVTAGLDAAMAPLRLEGGPAIRCMTLEEGPYGIESQADAAAVVLPLRRVVTSSEASAFVIACYSDPGLMVCREATTKPVFGIAESGTLAALQRGDRFGVVAILERSIPGHLRTLRQQGLAARLAGERALELTVAELANEDRTWDKLLRTALALRDEDRANAIVLGCAGMSRYRARLEQALGIAVIDPTQAAAVAALGTVLLQNAR
ncbi:MAG: Asp/Glu racemase [Geminicoccaceae bacterium]|nr:MAG: Asp/Glu racemase [Geminicoccaceae bacterium]